MINGLATHLSTWKQKDLADFRNKLQNCVPKRNEDSKINRIYGMRCIINPLYRFLKKSSVSSQY